MLTQAVSDLGATQAAQDPVPTALSLEEAMARALKYNLELRAKRIEEAMALNLLGATKGDMLPKLLGQLGYFERDNDRISLSRDTTVAGAPLVPSRFVSQERSHVVSELGLSWSILDFGLGYYRSKQQADRVLVAAERRRKAMHLVLQDVRTAYWRLASAQALESRLNSTVAEAESALDAARTAESDGDKDPLASTRYQRTLLENLRLLDAIKQELASAQVDLALLINAPAGVRLVVSGPDAQDELSPLLDLSAEQLEHLALSRNPDVSEQHYNVRIARTEARAALLRLFPNLSFGYSLNRDSDRYLVNQSWQQVSTQLSYNFLSPLTYPAVKAYGEAGIQLAEQRRRLAQAALLAQVHLARLQLDNSQQQLSRARDIYLTDARVAKITANREAAEAEGRLERISARTTSLLSELRYFQARASLQVANARLIATLGAEPEIPSVTDTPLDSLTELLRHAKPSLALPGETAPAPAPAPAEPTAAPSEPAAAPTEPAAAPAPATATPSTPPSTPVDAPPAEATPAPAAPAEAPPAEPAPAAPAPSETKPTEPTPAEPGPGSHS